MARSLSVGGVLFTPRLNAGIPKAGTGYEGGNLLAINSFYLQIIIGALILVAAFFDQWQSRRFVPGK
jgi:ribose transport system permease protein